MKNSKLQREIAAKNCKIAHDQMNFKNGSCLDILKSKTYSNNTSSVKGVSWYEKSSKWRAQIRYAGRGYYLGLYDELEDAAADRKKVEDFIINNFDRPDLIIEYMENQMWKE